MRDSAVRVVAALATSAVVIGTTTTGCAWVGDVLMGNRQEEADSVARQISSLPGVSKAEPDYKNDFTSGERFTVRASLDEGSTPAQAAEVGRTFVALAGAAGFETANSAELVLTYPAHPRPSNYLDDTSRASVGYGRSAGPGTPDGDRIADGFSAWLQAAQSPVAESVVTSWRDDAMRVTVNLKPDATAGQARDLQQKVPGLADASWVINVVESESSRPDSYRSTPHPPDDNIIALWNELSDAVRPYGQISGSTGPTSKYRPAPTELEVSLPGGRDSEPDQLSIPVEVAQLATGFGHPVELVTHGTVGSVEIIVGGCFAHRPDHEPTALERNMSGRFEKC
ncbi:hypothetical protein [Mycolicibacterium fortuitum]|uniref:hypothetical protein n=1 Tax=Mycolicibacterium fortuitum TaxID=1766 RepID=UPI000B226FEA|nr:hypothetical protein [Mycolicibacterium fortuitum]WEV35193.1 hypothetical protein OMF10_12895 [Mycolicibacterium fortuitum]BDD98479.1 hypothetical protein MFTT_25730 [Mycolicibacterium fortuitum subsp. fortuitum]CRL56323.1 hypothetical protein CPGR_03639 [Mycolicibacterium fortuitum subsp. fortuitum DSM 46621 = ATCC 6841 = JCM 6387]CRL81250.1 hypothetical protein CPGR_04464 [Mycolicibacter nonchromogenicus]